MRLFHCAGFRWERGFHAVTNTATVEPWLANSLSIDDERRPILISAVSVT
jgi:hypothetical protein